MGRIYYKLILRFYILHIIFKADGAESSAPRPPLAPTLCLNNTITLTTNYYYNSVLCDVRMACSQKNVRLSSRMTKTKVRMKTRCNVAA